jgi:hypothetical protein
MFNSNLLLLNLKKKNLIFTIPNQKQEGNKLTFIIWKQENLQYTLYKIFGISNRYVIYHGAAILTKYYPN